MRCNIRSTQDETDKCVTSSFSTEVVRRSEVDRTVKRYMFACGFVSSLTSTVPVTPPYAWNVPAATTLLMDGSTPFSTFMWRPSLMTLLTQARSMGLPALKTS